MVLLSIPFNYLPWLKSQFFYNFTTSHSIHNDFFFKYLKFPFSLYLSGIHELLHESLMRCEEKYRSRLLSNIVLTGGNSLFPGFDLRLEAELVKLLPDNLSKYVKVNAQPGRENFTWKGGVHLCSLDSFQGLWLTKQDYMETGGSDVQETTVLEQEVESTCESQIL